VVSEIIEKRKSLNWRNDIGGDTRGSQKSLDLYRQ
jgi:hypothetical protein